MKVPQTAPTFDAETRLAVDDVLASGWLTEGAQCEAFTAELLAYMGAEYGSLVSNGTTALTLGLWAAGVKPGQRVLVPDLTFAASANAVVAVGATPVLVDAYDHEPRGDASMPVWLFGNRPAPFGVTAPVVVEDAAQAVGCWQDDKHAGTTADVACFSFYADKILTTGEGGFVVSRTRETWEQVEALRNHGRLKGVRGYAHEHFGVNARMTDMQAAIGRVGLRRLPEDRQRRLWHWGHYADQLSDLPGLTIEPVDEGSVPFRCVVMVSEPEKLAAHLEAHEVQTRRMFPPLHKQPFLSQFVEPNQRFDHADKAHAHGLLLSVHQNLTDDQVEYVCETVRGFYLG